MADRMRPLVVEMQAKLKGPRVNRREFYILCLVLSRGIDATLRGNIVPSCKAELLRLLKQIAMWKDDHEVRPGILVLMMSVKRAIQHSWFSPAEANDLLKCVKPLFEVFNFLPASTTTNIEQLASVLQRFHPWLKVERVLLACEEVPGYAAKVFDFVIESKLQGREAVRLFVIENEKLGTPACLVAPALVSFILNGKNIEKRTLTSMPGGPQAPTNCTTLLKTGNNCLQILGEFEGHYTIVLAVMTPAVLFRKENLLEIQPQALHSDEDVMEGPSKVSLCCPISCKRITTPVRGVSCKHLQCFDFFNYMELNRSRPAWRCPSCSTLTTCEDLRLDKKTSEILQETGEEVLDVMLSSDGSWSIPPSEQTWPIELQGDEVDNPTVPAPLVFRAMPGASDRERKPSLVEPPDVMFIRQSNNLLPFPRSRTSSPRPPSQEQQQQQQQQQQGQWPQQSPFHQLIQDQQLQQQIQELQHQLHQQQQLLQWQQSVRMQEQQQQMNQPFVAPAYDPQWFPSTSTTASVMRPCSTPGPLNGAGSRML